MNAYLEDLGYSKEDIKAYTDHWNESVQRFLNEQQANVSRNMQFLQPYFDRDLLLKLPVFYPESFALPPDDFENSMDLLRTAFPDEWTGIVQKQFFAFDGYSVYMQRDDGTACLYEPYLQIIGTGSDEKIQMAIHSLLEPATRRYAFIAMLQQKTGLSITAEDVDEDWLQDLETAKNEVIANVRLLQSNGVREDAITSFFRSAPFVLMFSEKGLRDTLVKKIGPDFAEQLNRSDCPDELISDALF